MNTMLRILATRCMMQAVYFVSGTLQKEEYFHYGLAVPLYTHFTSPIRRYADIIVHRLLAVSCSADVTYPDLLDKKKTDSLCQNLNYRNRMAQYAGRASIAFNTHVTGIYYYFYCCLTFVCFSCSSKENYKMKKVTCCMLERMHCRF